MAAAEMWQPFSIGVFGKVWYTFYISLDGEKRYAFW